VPRFAVSDDIGPNRTRQFLKSLGIAFHERRQNFEGLCCGVRRLRMAVERSQNAGRRADARRQIGKERVRANSARRLLTATASSLAASATS
jgi:hypothetical protein